MQNTTNYNLKKPDLTDYVNVEDLNENMEIIDQELKNQDEKVTTHLAEKASQDKLGHIKAETNIDGMLVFPPPKLIIEKFDVPGTYSWIAPEGVNEVMLSGCGAGGGAGHYAGTKGGAGGITSFGSLLSLPGGGGSGVTASTGGKSGGPGGGVGRVAIMGGSSTAKVRIGIGGEGGHTPFGSASSGNSSFGYGAGGSGLVDIKETVVTTANGGGGGASVVDKLITVIPGTAYAITVGLAGTTGTYGVASPGSGLLIIKYFQVN